MFHTANVLLDIFIIFLAAKVAGELFDRLNQPPVVGELLAGMVIGPHMLGLLGTPDPLLVRLFHDAPTAREALTTIYDVLAEVGAIVLLFFVGLETRVHEIVMVGLRAAAVGVAGMVLPFVLGVLLVAYTGGSNEQAMFLGAAMVATSIGITARVLSDLGATRTREARIILGAAVIDDILGMIVLAVVAGLGASGSASAGHVVVIAAEAIVFTGFVALIGTRVVRRYSLHLQVLRARNAPFVVAMAVCLGLAVAASYVGLAAIIGAFLAGMVFAETRERGDLLRSVEPVYDLLVPFFFVVAGAQVDPSVFLDGRLAGLALGVTVLAIIGKVVGCGVGAWGLGARSMGIVGAGMVPRGEVGIIVASIGLSLNAISGQIFSVVVTMSILTSLMVPSTLKWLYRGYVREPAGSASQAKNAMEIEDDH